MKIYKIKKLIPGYSVDESLRGKIVVACPDNLLKYTLKLYYQNRFMVIPKGKKALLYRRFADKFGRDKVYILAYYEWQPYTEVNIEDEKIEIPFEVKEKLLNIYKKLNN